MFEEKLASATILISILGPVYTTRKEFERRGFTLKTHEIFSVRITPEKFENAAITVQFGFVFEENLGREIT